MKAFLINLIFIVQIIPAFAQKDEKAVIVYPTEIKQLRKDLEQIDGIWYNKNTEIPYTGFFIYNGFNDGNKMMEGFIKDGVYHGSIIYFYSDGKSPRRKENYVYGIIDGIQEDYFENGQVQHQSEFKFGKQVGVAKEWYSTGKLRQEFIIKDGEISFTKDQEQYYELHRKAYEQLRKRNFKQSKNTLDKIIQMFPNDDYTYIQRAEALMEQYKFDEAIKDLDKVLELEPQNITGLSSRAFARVRKYESQRKKLMRKDVKGISIKNKVEIPQEDLMQVCADLTKARNRLPEDKNKMVIDAIKTYCQ